MYKTIQRTNQPLKAAQNIVMEFHIHSRPGTNYCLGLTVRVGYLVWCHQLNFGACVLEELSMVKIVKVLRGMQRIDEPSTGTSGAVAVEPTPGAPGVVAVEPSLEGEPCTSTG